MADEKRVLQAANQKYPDTQAANQKPAVQVEPPDGGAWAWLVMVSCFVCNGVIFGIINTFGILFVKLRTDLEAAGVEDAALKCSIVGSLTIGCTFFLSFLVGVLSDKIGLRQTAVLGGVTATLGMALSTYYYQTIEVMYFSYGILFGSGASLAYTPSLTVLGHYFRRHLGVVNGVVTAGSSVFTIALSFINQHILYTYGVGACLQLLTCLSSLLVLCGLTYRPLLPPTPRPVPRPGQSKVRVLIERLVYVPNFRNRRYIIWALAVPSALFGYFVPYVHLVQFAKNIPLDEDNVVNGDKASYLVACIGITSGLGRLIFGKMADLKRVQEGGGRIVLQQVAFLAIGICTMLLTFAPYCQNFVFEALLILCCVMGIFDGCFVTMMGPIAFDICGPAGAGQAIGFVLALASIPLTLGPPVAGAIYDHVGNYFAAFLGAGVSPILGALIMLVIRRFPQQPDPAVKPEERSETHEQKEKLLTPVS